MCYVLVRVCSLVEGGGGGGGGLPMITRTSLVNLVIWPSQSQANKQPETLGTSPSEFLWLIQLIHGV